jgi:hypothetical protein
MPTYDKFEKQIEEILDEGFGWGDAWNATTKAVNKITGSNIEWQGIATNKYESDKNYYPNIRKGWGGVLANRRNDDASQEFLEKIAGYRKESGVPDNILSDKDSPKEQKQKAPTKMGESFSFDQTLGIFEAGLVPLDDPDAPTIDSAQPESFGAKAKRVRRPKPEAVGVAAKADIRNMRIRTQQAANQKSKETRSGNKSKKEQAQEAAIAKTLSDLLERQARLGTDFIDVELWESSGGKTCCIYKDKWNEFLDIVQNAIVGASQRSYLVGASAYNILRGEGGRSPKGIAPYTQTQVIQPKLLEAFHEQIMKPLFLAKPNNVLIYATAEQWKSITAGSSLYKGTVGALHQAMTAGKNAPKVTL